VSYPAKSRGPFLWLRRSPMFIVTNRKGDELQRSGI
jgi:hypothetical protein